MCGVLLLLFFRVRAEMSTAIAGCLQSKADEELMKQLAGLQEETSRHAYDGNWGCSVVIWILRQCPA
jgi:hypothetical protein